MPKFESRPYRSTRTSHLNAQIKRHPTLLFGIPFILTIVLGSVGLAQITSVRYDSHDKKVNQLSQEEKLGLDHNRRKINLRDEYYKLQGKSDELDNYENKRVERPKGIPDNILKNE